MTIISTLFSNVSRSVVSNHFQNIENPLFNEKKQVIDLSYVLLVISRFNLKFVKQKVSDTVERASQGVDQVCWLHTLSSVGRHKCTLVTIGSYDELKLHNIKYNIMF